LGDHSRARAAPGEPIIDKPGKGSVLCDRPRTAAAHARLAHIVLSGITTDVCVHTTMREATDAASMRAAGGLLRRTTLAIIWRA